jgi:LuxR family transcriptional regulator, maltose regulon positive regulatory protein
MLRKAPTLAKLSRPRLYDALPRERLFRLLDQARQHPSIWISGPPGAGKTVLIASYLESRQLPGIWFHVDPGDTDASTFFYYLSESAQAFVRKSSPLPLLTPEYLPDLDGFSRRYFRELFGLFPQSSVIVFDNFQDVPQDGAIPRVLSAAIAEVPEHVSLICISRTDPPQDFSRHIANEAIARIGWEQLRLTSDEALAIANKRGAIDPRVLERLYEKSDGWAAGLTLAIERFRGRPVDDAEIERLAADATFDYFATQIFDAASERDKSTLLRTSIFSSFTLNTAIAVSGNPEAEGLLDALCRRQLFTYKRGATEPRYQYHDLFRDFLRKRLRESIPETELRALLACAGRMMRDKGELEGAFPPLRDAQLWEDAAGTIRSLAPQLLAQGRWQTLRDWIRDLPEDLVQTNPWLLYWAGSARVYEGVADARALFERAFETFRGNADDLGQLLCAAWIIRTYYLEYTNFQPLDRWVEEIEAILARGHTFASTAHEIHVLGALMIAFTYRHSGHPLIGNVVSRLTDLLQGEGDRNQIVAAATGLMIYHTLAMEPDRARNIVERIYPAVESPEVTPLNKAWWWMFVGYQYHRAGDRELTIQALERSDRIAAAYGLRQTAFFSHCFRAYYWIAWREFVTAKASVEKLESTFGQRQPMHMAQFHLASYFIAFSTQDVAGALHHARIAVESATKLGSPFFFVSWRAHCAPALAVAGDIELANKWLDEAWSASEATFMERYRPSILQSRALCSSLRDDRIGARRQLAESIALGKEFNAWPYARGTVPLYDWMVREALLAGIEVPYIQVFIRKFKVPPPEIEVPNWPWPVRVFTLGAFRIEVDGEPLVFPRKAPKKPLSLLKAIIAFGGKNVPEQKLVDALWADEEEHAAREALAVSLHRLRKLLVHPDAVQLVEGQISLDATVCWIDTWAFARVTPDNANSTKNGITEAVWEIYRGHFLAEEIDAPWALSTRERLRAQFLRYVSRVGRQLENDGKPDLAVLLYQKGIEADDLAEELYQGLMHCMMQLERRAEGMAAYRRLRQTLSVTLGIAPSAQSEKLFKALQDN